MAKSRNNLLGVGGQRKKLPKNGQGSAPVRAADRKAAEDQKQELLRKMRERAQVKKKPESDEQSDQQSDK